MTPISVSLSIQNYPSTTVRASFKNESPDKCYEVPNYLLMENNRPHGNLQISNKLTGEEAVYVGPNVKLKPSYKAIQPGETKDVEVHLSERHEMKHGQYTVKYLSMLAYRECGGNTKFYHDPVESNTIDIMV